MRTNLKERFTFSRLMTLLTFVAMMSLASAAMSSCRKTELDDIKRKIDHKRDVGGGDDGGGRGGDDGGKGDDGGGRGDEGGDGGGRDGGDDGKGTRGG